MTGPARSSYRHVPPPLASGFALNLSPPPADADEQEAPVGKEFRRLAFEGVTDELENPSEDKQSQHVGPETMKKDADEKNYEREDDGWDAESVADPVHRMLMAGSVLRDPLLVGAVTQHGGKNDTPVETSSPWIYGGIYANTV